MKYKSIATAFLLLLSACAEVSESSEGESELQTEPAADLGEKSEELVLPFFCFNFTNQVALRASNGKIVTFENSTMANKTTLGAWEKLRVHDLGNGVIAMGIGPYSGGPWEDRWVAASAGTGIGWTFGPPRGSANLFTVEPQWNGTFAIRTDDFGKGYFTLRNDGRVDATAKTIGPAQQFRVICI